MNKVLEFRTFGSFSTNPVDSKKYTQSHKYASDTETQQSSHRQHSTSNMKPTPPQTPQQECHLNDLGYCFVKKCIEIIENRGLNEQGLYRIGGVNSRVSRLLQLCLDRKNQNSHTGQVSMPDFSDPIEWETKTITSALKNYLRNLSEPLITYNLHSSIIDAAKIEDHDVRAVTIKNLIQQLPNENFALLKILVLHLRRVSQHSHKNLMTVSNLGICFAPTLMRGPDENSLAIADIKYSNVVATALIEGYDAIFESPRENPAEGRHNRQSSQQLQPHQDQNMLNQRQYPNHTYSSHQSLDEQSALGLPNYTSHQHVPSIQFQLHHQQVSYQAYAQTANNATNTFHLRQNSDRHLDKQTEIKNESNDLAQFALKSYDNSSQHQKINHPSGVYIQPQLIHPPPPPPLMGSHSSLAPYDVRPVNDVKTFPIDRTQLVPVEQPYPYYGHINHTVPYQIIHQPNPIQYSNSAKVVTLYACVADTDSELSFSQNEIITDVRRSVEAGWLIGTLERNGQRGLLPENYVRFI